MNTFSLAIWNTMMGTSLLSVPWAIKQSGLVASVIIGLGMALVAMYTALLVIKIHAKYGKRPLILFYRGYSWPLSYYLCIFLYSSIYQKLT